MIRFAILLSLLVLGAAGCRPDLVVENVSSDIAAGTVTATIKNIGSADADGFLVYFNADEDPESESYMQVSRSVPGLARGRSLTLAPAKFTPIPGQKNNFRRKIYQVTVIVDPENSVKELREGNNDKSIPCHFPDKS